MSPQQFIFTMLLLVPLSSALLGGQRDLSPRVYCGRALARVIAEMCYDIPPSPDKRSEVGTMYGPLIPPYYKEQQENHIGWPWTSSKSTALGSIRGKRFISGGVADECCDKPCSISELLYYC